MAITADQVPIIMSAGATALGLAALLWALRVSDGARGAARKYKDRSSDLETLLAEHRSILGAHPGVILVWQGEALEPDSEEMTPPELYGSPVALAGLLSFTDDAISPDPAVRIIEGLADLEARDSSGQDTTLRIRMRELRDTGQAFSLTIIGPSGRFLEADGRTAGARAVVWVTDTTIKGLEESSARGKLEEARQVIARDPTAFLDMLGKAPFPAWRVSGMGKLQWVNPSYIEAVDGVNLDRVLDRQIMLDQASADQARKTISEGADIDETRHMVVNGERRAMRVLTFPLSGGAGAMAFDVTAQENAREELNRHVRAHDETLNHVADAVAIFGADRKLTFYNKAFRDMWDLDESFLLDRPNHGQLLDRLRERRKLPARTNYAEWRAEELSYYLDIDGVKEDTWSLPDDRTLSVTRQRHPMGGLLLLFKDITGELNLQTKFNAIVKTQASTLDNLHEAVVVFGGDGRLKLFNKAFERLWSLDHDELKDHPDYSDVIEDCVPLFHDLDVWDAIKGHITDPSARARQSTTGEMRRSDGSILTYLTHPLPDGNTLIAFADVTATRRVESALRDRAEAFEAADRLKTEFVRNVSYQLRSPLTVIFGYAELLETKRNGDLTERQTDYVSAILSASDHLSKLIENILDLAMIEAGRMDLDLKDVDLSHVIEESIDMVVSKAEDTQIAVRADIKGKLGVIRADERRIRQVLFNLISNSLRFTESGGEIVVSSQRVGDMVTLSVRDNGRGLAADKRATSFDSFVSGDQRGAGLGLALVKHFIDLHGGTVGMKPVDGGGLEVTCWLPVKVTKVVQNQEMLLTESLPA
ncbi:MULTISPECIES: sensor histidine kinase [unclassified Hyphomonas]|jgi:signal transduction histidine kinase|uniref:histidine kinase n=5 Tax=root TaxID=1 RepID=A0A160TYZ0_9ZZZZ|nr:MULTISPECIES: PAS domain-containing sensor histidine kinase [unclassified Hyphomonas]MDF1805748.1 PAS-domain containing protein [Hyphomonas sp.]|tara:strand:- start:6566 stop:9016 length:2451 start_codon:yes stop_codon:yes gene_type:complete